MIWFTSDLHGGADIDGLNHFLSFCGNDDWLIILGDTEFHFRETEENKKFSEYFEALDCNIALIDGNHENFDYLYSLPEENWNGGRIHRISDRIVHLMRGYIFELEGKTFLTMGGCASSQKWKDWGLWWHQESPNAEELQRAYISLAERNNCVDYVLTHKYRLEPLPFNPLTLEGFIQYVEKNVTYKHWYSGHWHKNECVDPKHTTVFNELITIQ